MSYSPPISEVPDTVVQTGNIGELTSLVRAKIRLWEETSKQYSGILPEFKKHPELLNRLVRLFRGSSSTVDELQQKVTDFYVRAMANEPALQNGSTMVPNEVRPAMTEFLRRLEKTGPYCQAGELGPMLEEVRTLFGLEQETLHCSLRSALTGCAGGPDMKGILAVLGIDRIIRRLQRILNN